MIRKYDVAVIGAGLAGLFTCYNILKNKPKTKIALIDIGKQFLKRRSQMIGALGILPNSDGKLYISDIAKVERLTSKKDFVNKNANESLEFINSIINISPTYTNKLDDKFLDKTKDYNLTYNDYYQLYPGDVHKLTKYFSEKLSEYKNVNFIFDTEVFDIFKKDDFYYIESDLDKHIYSKNIVLACGRSGWRWTKEVFKELDIKYEDYCYYGFQVEIAKDFVKYLNESCFTLESDELRIGSFNWNGSTIPEDHIDFINASFRSNEDRWKSDKLLFPVIIKDKTNNSAEAERIAKLQYILSNDRLSKEKVIAILSNRSKIIDLKEYKKYKEVINTISNIIPEVEDRAWIVYPHIDTCSIKPETNDYFMAKDNFYLAGETLGISGFLSAITTGSIVGNAITKEI